MGAKVRIVRENLIHFTKVYTAIGSSEVYSDETFSSNESEPDYVDEYELEVEQFDVGATSHETRGKASEDSVATVASIFPYTDEPISDPEWAEKYEKEKEKEKLHVEALQQRLDGAVATSEW